MGANNSGKSTILEVLALLSTWDNGHYDSLDRAILHKLFEVLGYRAELLIRYGSVRAVICGEFDKGRVGSIGRWTKM